MANEKIFPDSKWQRLVSDERNKSLEREKFFDISTPTENDVWADIGCGPGYFTLPLAQKVKKVYAVDISEKMLDVCKTRAEDASIYNIDYIVSSAESFNLLPNSIEKALFVTVFHELDDKKEAVKEIKKILREEGRVYIIDWKYEELDYGPSIEHKLPASEVIDYFVNEGFRLEKNLNIYPNYYFLVFYNK